VIGQGLHADRRGRVEQRAAELLDGGRDAGRYQRHVDGQLLRHAHEEQVGMDRATVDRMDLDAMDEDRLGRPAVDRQVDQRVGPDVLSQHIELVGVDRDIARFDPVPIHHGGQLTFLAEVSDGLAGDRSVSGGQRRAGGCHAGVGPQDVDVVEAGCDSPAGPEWRGARSGP
jgi:hypothetical protein